MSEPEFSQELIERCLKAVRGGKPFHHQDDDKDVISVLRESGHAELVAALKEARKLGMKIYHNANAHEAPKDWASVKELIDAALKKAGAL